MTALHELTIIEMGRWLRSGRARATELAQAAIARTERVDKTIHAFILVTFERALADAERADAELAAGIDRGPLHGIPYALKDIYDSKDLPTTCHSALTAGHLAMEDAEVERRMKRAGAVLLGKLATHEFALGGPSNDLPYPCARNPWDTERFTGGSSSGCAAALASAQVPLAWGSDTSGSIRTPACFCGVVGLKPTFGLVSRRGVFPLSYSLDHCGPMSRTVADAALALEAVAGHDPLDPVSARISARNYTSRLAEGIKNKRIGYFRRWLVETPNVSPTVIKRVDHVVSMLAANGAEVVEIAGPDLELLNACGRIIMSAESFAIHESNIRSRPLDFGRYAYQRIAPGAILSAADLILSQRVRRELVQLMEQCMLGLDAAIAATSPSTAPLLSAFHEDWEPASLSHTIGFDVTGHPALAMPAGVTPERLPVGVQVIGHLFDEASVFSIAASLESLLADATISSPMASPQPA
ncbi:Aspartyl-tRNA(Asn) amidotransferase subunit A Glutamyl-tRNA(Gln) amidotransferase subunit A [Candidatus Paraburkholderia calva]|nr:Aspartyl-tRNA(Asn) amidotransferase subunit A Glutamyl-tRNA(Gln) amidotransferase subunit A [Candidatus Paraburkholderia calva]